MTPDRGPIGPWVWISFVLSAVIALGIQVGVLGGILSPSVWIDVVALWPVAAVGLLAAPIVWLTAGRGLRHLAIGGLSIFTWLLLGLGMHLSGAQAFPVSSASVTGPPAAGIDTADLEIELDTGTIDIAGGTEALYRIEPIRAGGDVGAPTAYEQSLDGRTTVVVVPRVDSGAYVFRGWVIELDAGTAWTLDVAAERIAADLRSLVVNRVTLTSSTCELHLGPPDGAIAIELVGGRCEVFVEQDVAATFEGQGAVPGDWSVDESGIARSPASGQGWTILGSDGAVTRVRYG